MRKLLFLKNNNKIKINGSPVQVPQNLIDFFSIRTNNVVEQELSNFMKDNLKPGHVFVDVGSNIGLLALEASGLVGDSGKVIAFEPNPWCYKQLTEITSLNKKENIFAFCLALSREEGWITLNMNKSDSVLMTRSSMIFSDDNAQKTSVLAKRLDDFLPRKGPITILKIDVEGAEMEVLEGSKQLILEHRPIVSLEVHGVFFDDPVGHVSRVFDFFEAIQYRCYNLIKRKQETLENFIHDSGVEGKDPVSGKDFSKNGYGQLIYCPSEKKVIV